MTQRFQNLFGEYGIGRQQGVTHGYDATAALDDLSCGTVPERIKQSVEPRASGIGLAKHIVVHLLLVTQLKHPQAIQAMNLGQDSRFRRGPEDNYVEFGSVLQS
jgi:hypothetical protein